MNSDIVYENVYLLDGMGILHMRDAYNLLDFLDNIAGIYDLVKGFLGVMIFQFSYHSFILSAIKKLFLVKCSHDHHI